MSRNGLNNSKPNPLTRMARIASFDIDMDRPNITQSPRRNTNPDTKHINDSDSDSKESKQIPATNSIIITTNQNNKGENSNPVSGGNPGSGSSRDESSGICGCGNGNSGCAGNHGSGGNPGCDNGFKPRKVKYPVIDDNGIKTEIEMELKTPADLHKIPSKYLTAQERVYLKEERWTPSRVLMNHLEEKLNITIGKHWWKKYVSAAFWSNIATPINLAITLFTTLSTGQAATDSLLSQNVFIRISIASLILSTLNTFFRPHQQMNINMDAMNKWRQLGAKFEEIYYSECFNDLDYERRIKGYQEIQKDVHTEQIAQETAIQNYLTDFIYFCVANSCLSKSEWITEKHKPNISQNKSNTTGKQAIQTGNSSTQTEHSGSDTIIQMPDESTVSNPLSRPIETEMATLKNQNTQLLEQCQFYKSIIDKFNLEEMNEELDGKDVYLDNLYITKNRK